MADKNTGRKRALTLSITKKINGNVVSGYPHVYSGTTSFTWNDVTYPTIDASTFQKMKHEDYLVRLEDFKQYVQSVETGLNVDNDLDPSSQPCIIDGTCPMPVDQCTTYFYLSKMSSSASGYILNAGVGIENYLISGTEGTLVSVTGVTTNGSEIIGWSDDIYGNNILTTGATFNIPISCGKKYYFVVTQNIVLSKTFCYYPPSTILDEICAKCNETVTVYFDKSEVDINGIDNVTWYSDFELTQVAETGYYKLVGTNSYNGISNGGVYTITDGTVMEKGFCDPDLLYCCV